jgi:hypothetical protein
MKRLTRRPLPKRNPEIGACPAVDRKAISASWYRRSRSEGNIGATFAAVAAGAKLKELNGRIIARLEKVQADEQRHSEICRTVASRYAGNELAPHVIEPVRLPPGATRMDQICRIIEICCIGKTLGAAFLEGNSSASAPGLAQRALQELLADEVIHARIGWALLRLIGPKERLAVQQALRPMCVANLQAWRAGLAALSPEQFPAHGCPAPAYTQQLIVYAMHELVLPSFRNEGFDASFRVG